VRDVVRSTPSGIVAASAQSDLGRSNPAARPRRCPGAGRFSTRGDLQAHTANRSDASHHSGSTSLSKQQREFGRLSLSREGSGRRRCGRDGWFAAKAAMADRLGVS
jgi:hypothetical protein